MPGRTRSASTTKSRSPASFALPPQSFTRPPARPVGSSPAAVRASVVITVVVVFPCVPAIAAVVPLAMRWARASLRGTIGTPAARAADSSGCSRGTAAVTTTARAPATWLGSCPLETTAPRAATSAAPLGSLSHPVTKTPRRRAMRAKALIPAPPIPMKWMGRESDGSKRSMLGKLI
jgi:hypothetical protein